MTIYTEFVFEDRLVSPINGHTCKRICKQNIKNFGFDTIQDLHNLYPEFPLGCSEYENARNSNMSITNKAKYLELKFNKEQQRINDEIEYNLNPKICIYCGNKFEFIKRKCKYCSGKCRAINTNKNRGSHSDGRKIGLGVSLKAKIKIKIPKTKIFKPRLKRITRNKILNEIPYSLKLISENKMCRITINTCQKSGKKFCSRTWQKYHPKLIENKSDYARQCKFNFGLSSYPLWFDLSLLETHGMYCTPGSGKKGISNPNGVSRDHMISITYGWKNDIDPKLMSHPGNCQLMATQRKFQ